VFKQWTDTVYRYGGNGALYWILSDKQDDGSLYPDYDGFTVYCPSPVCITLSNFSRHIAWEDFLFPPVADDDTAVTEFNTPATLNPPANDITYNNAKLVLASLDLDPAAAGVQTSRAVAGGTFARQADSSVLFTPAQDFAGKAAIAYTIRDSFGRASNQAQLSVTVKPDPTAAILLAGFETGTEGWAPGNWQTDAGTVEQSADFATEGTSSLKFTAINGGWLGVTFPTPVNLAGKTHIKVDIKTLGTGTSQNVALQIGPSFEWCQGNWGWVNSDSTATTDIDLVGGFSCDISTKPMNDVRGMYIFFSGNGTFYLDNVRAE
jgi:mannan endo-1,4-beta-mannosidase